MRYLMVPAGTWALFARSFREGLTEVLGYDGPTSAQITKKPTGDTGN